MGSVWSGRETVSRIEGKGENDHTLTASSNALAMSFKSLSRVLIFPTGLRAKGFSFCVAHQGMIHIHYILLPNKVEQSSSILDSLRKGL